MSYPDAYEFRMPKYGCTSCGAVHDFPTAAMFCNHSKAEPDNVLPDATRVRLETK